RWRCPKAVWVCNSGFALVGIEIYWLIGYGMMIRAAGEMQPDLGRRGCRHRCRPAIEMADESTKWKKTRDLCECGVTATYYGAMAVVRIASRRFARIVALTVVVSGDDW
ncbi:Hypothetical predicted protein, partial [Olea europaea subsp. europaea]